MTLSLTGLMIATHQEPALFMVQAPFQLTETIDILFSQHDASRCLAYAVQEAGRLLARLGVRTRILAADAGHGDLFFLTLARSGASAEVSKQSAAKLKTQKPDGYQLRITTTAATITSRSDKGILNGVYDLAQRMGFLFLLPGDEGEWLPQTGPAPIELPTCDEVMDPRFEHRGVFWEPLTTKDYSMEEWLRFYAKLRFNAVTIGDIQYATMRPLTQELGLRLELGGHGFRALMPRELFATNPDLFRMFQPDDFGGKRNSDSNCCVTHPQTKQIVQENYKKRLQTVGDVYAMHCWADDLPAGGWCMCPSCRALTPSDQAMLAMRHLAQVAAQQSPPVRVPILAYHDTMFPGSMIAPSKECFLLFAPRERCYAHALDDASCARNRHYFKALEAWTQQFKQIDDAHTFEYYFDQILFRGIYPFLPSVIIEDMRVYEAAGIQTHMALQVAGPEIAPEFNMLVFAQAHWDRALTAEKYIEEVASKIQPQSPEVWRNYLRSRAELFTAAMATCDHELGIYLDYRWLPETTNAFGEKIAHVYADASRQLAAATHALQNATGTNGPACVKKLVANETARACFEAAELGVMAHQQAGMNALGNYHNTGNVAQIKAAAASLEQAISEFRDARIKATAAGIGPDEWYMKNINQWISKELAAKIQRYSAVI